MFHLMLSWISIAAAVVAAIFWLRAGLIKTPPVISVGFGGVGGDLIPLSAALQSQGRANAIGALAAGTSALAQAVLQIGAQFGGS